MKVKDVLEALKGVDPEKQIRIRDTTYWWPFRNVYRKVIKIQHFKGYIAFMFKD